MRSLVSLFFGLLLVTTSYQYGILRVEEIWSNLDTSTVIIEEIIIKESDIFVDYIEDISLEGVTVEGSIFSNGAINVPGNLTTTAGIKFFNPLFANGEIIADAGVNSGEISFSIARDTGNTFILGEVRAQGGINLENGKFIVEETTGATTISDALLRPNGGINVRDNLFTANTEGDIYTKSNAHFSDNIYFGTNDRSDRIIERIPASGPAGGSTYLQGQNAAFRGGDIFLEPGDALLRPGNIFIGDSSPRDLWFGRSALTNGLNGGLFTFAGQNSKNGDGGKVIISAGHSTGIAGVGGDIIIAPGISDGAGIVGELILGSTNKNTSGYDLIIGRPELDDGDGGITILEGQNTNFGIGGNFYFRAGSVRSGVGKPGNLIISPGDSIPTLEGNIYLGRPLAVSLTIRRTAVGTSAGQTAITGQTALSGKGGDLYIAGGKAGTLQFTGGDLYLEPGSSRSGEFGSIYVGRSTDPLILGRPSSGGNGRETIITGQEGLIGAGGDMIIAAGEGHSSGGDLYIASGSGKTGSTGDISILGGDTVVGSGGDITFRAGHGTKENGGNINISPGSSTAGVGGSVSFSAGSGTTLGNIIIGPAVRQLYVEQIPVVVNNGQLVITGGEDQLILAADTASVLAYNGNMVIKTTIPITIYSQGDYSDVLREVNILRSNYNAIVRALTNSPNCGGHGLVYIVDEGTQITTC